MPQTSFEADIRPILRKYVSHMRWRLDLTNYQDVMENAHILLDRMESDDSLHVMPPPSFGQFSTEFKDTFKTWMHEEFPP